MRMTDWADDAMDLAASVGRRALGAARGSTPDAPEVDAVLAEPTLEAALTRHAAEHGTPLEHVRAEAAGHLLDMMASHAQRATKSWDWLGGWFMRAHDVLVDEEQMVQLRQLDRGHSLAIVFSHRSYLDGWVLPHVLASRRFSPTFTFGGANLDLPVIGHLVSHTGVIFIKRATKELPVYRLSLRGYISHLVRGRSNLAWSIEGGRTRTGKLRPPVHGILRYLCDAAEVSDGPDVMLVPVAIVYDQLHEVAGMTAEARGSGKRPENLAWLVRFARSQRGRLGRAYVSVGEPMPLRERMAQLRAEGNDTMQSVERVAIDASHRINRATPVTVTAVVCLAMLGADRALTFDRVLDTVEPMASYIRARNWPVAGAASLTDRATIRRALQELVASGVLTAYDAGTEPVWRIAPDQHLVAAFYRNTVIHVLVDRAIGEVSLLAAQAAGHQRAASGEGAAAEHAAGDEAAAEHAAWEQAKALRDLLKFEFFFPGRDDFERELRGELGLITAGGVTTLTARVASDILGRVDLVIAPLVLRPFIDAYLVLADRLAAAGSEPIAEADEDALLDDALRVGEQWELERRIASAESVSLELFRTALRLARHRGLLAAPPAAGDAPVPATTDIEPYAALPTLSERREAFRTELQHLAAHLDTLAHLAESRRRQPADAPATPHLVDAAARLVGTIGAGDEEAAAEGDVR